MKVLRYRWSACMFVYCVLSSAAQQQTGAPAGIAVPPAPVQAPQNGTQTGASGSAIFRVRVVDGRNGDPVRNAHVRLWYDEPAGEGYAFATDLRGYGNMPAPIGEPVRVLLAVADYGDCRRPMRGDPPQGYSLSSIAASGVATQNGCGRVAVHPSPGELVLFVRPGRWYENINRSAGN